MKIRIYPKIPGVRPMLFAEVTDVTIKQTENKWTIDFDHIDHINKEREVKSHSQFTSEGAMAYTLLYETHNDEFEVKYVK